MSILSCARAADNEARGTNATLDNLCGTEIRTWSKLTRAVSHQQDLQKTDIQNCVAALKESQERLSNDKENLASEVNEVKTRAIAMEAERNALLVQIQTLKRRLEVSEGENGRLIKEKLALKSELTTSQNSLRRLYKDLKILKSAQANSLNDNPKLLAPTALWQPTEIPTKVTVKQPVLPKDNKRLPGHPIVNTTNNVVVVVDDTLAPQKNARQPPQNAPRPKRAPSSKRTAALKK